jgi:superfamily I DNA and/or RNA helicase
VYNGRGCCYFTRGFYAKGDSTMKNYLGNRYWENEKPVVVNTGKNILRFYKNAGKLQISKQDWNIGGVRIAMGEIVTLDITALKRTPEGLEIIKQILE